MSLYNERKYGVTDPDWVTNSPFDPSNNPSGRFHRGEPQATRWFSRKALQSMGLYGWYRFRFAN